ncbi:hypothetical protein BH10CYA1_BH10CYA1_56040 [soil metagenome]
MSDIDSTLFKPGDLIGGCYEVVKTTFIGDSSAYVCKHNAFEKIVLIKFMTKNSSIDVNRFQLEAKCMSRVSHPNVLSVYDFGIGANSTPYLVMEYIDGETLAAILQRDGTLTLSRFKNLFGQACDALSAVHDQKIVHRDIKPANFLISCTDKGDEHLTLTEFTIVKAMSEQEPDRLVMAGELLGSPPYMSPEACQGMPVDHRTDIYALGCCMYEAIFGSSPFLGTSMLDTMSRQISEIPQLSMAGRPEFASMEYVVSRCLEKKPEDRFSTAAELKQSIVGKPVKKKYFGLKF